MSKIYGRASELKLLNDKFTSEKSELIVLYGRRRIGKSALIQEFCKDKTSLQFEGLEGEHSPEQIAHFSRRLAAQHKDPILAGVTFSTWDAVFSYITTYLEKQRQRTVIFMDEFQWQAAGQQKLVSLFKYYWDNHWKKQNVMLILCGSVSSFMVNKVIKSKALYGRVTLEINLKGLLPLDAKRMLRGQRSDDEVLKYLLVFGSVPKYLEEINVKRSFNQNINQLCFTPHGLMLNEIERIFFSQFRAPQTYFKITKALSERPLSQEDLRKIVNIPSGGGMLSYLNNLELAEFIRAYVPMGASKSSHLKKYQLIDEYLAFYFKYVRPNTQAIKDGDGGNLFERLSDKSLEKWLGFAFEKFCLKYQHHLARVMGFSDQVLRAGPYFRREAKGFQIDLLYQRSDKTITLCEVKYYQREISASVIADVEQKCALFALPRGYTLEKALISPYGPDKALAASGYFHHHVTLKDIFS